MTTPKLTASQKALVEEYLPLVQQVIYQHFFVSHTNVEMNLDDLTQLGSLALCKAAQKYDNERPFPAYAKTVIRNALFDYGRRLQLQSKTFCYLSEETESSLFYYDQYPEIEHHLQQLEDMASGQEEKRLHAFRLSLMGYTPTDISKTYGVTASAVRLWLKHCKQELGSNVSLMELLS